MERNQFFNFAAMPGTPQGLAFRARTAARMAAEIATEDKRENGRRAELAAAKEREDAEARRLHQVAEEEAQEEVLRTAARAAGLAAQAAAAADTAVASAAGGSDGAGERATGSTGALPDGAESLTLPPLRGAAVASAPNDGEGHVAGPLTLPPRRTAPV